MVQEAAKVPEEAVEPVPALIEEPVKDAAAAALAADAAAVAAGTPATTAATAAAAAAAAAVNASPTIVVSTGPPVAVQHPKEEETAAAAVNVFQQSRLQEEVALVEVGEAMIAANEIFNRVKSEKIAEQALCSIRNDQAQYEGLAKEIVGKAIKQKERERANRASAAASRAKVLRYQTELESRLNRMEAERNAYRKEVEALRSMGERRVTVDEVRVINKLQEWIRKLEAANPQFVRSVIAQGEMDKLLGEEEGLVVTEEEPKEEESAAKRRKLQA